MDNWQTDGRWTSSDGKSLHGLSPAELMKRGEYTTDTEKKSLE